jgi:hydroxymethylpyrimidine pyrophosphatase-like HAD family hydrolase
VSSWAIFNLQSAIFNLQFRNRQSTIGNRQCICSSPVRFLALATDYDCTLADDGVVAPRTLAAMKRLKHSGRKLILVTGRHLPDLQSVFPNLDLFDRVVAENGALLFHPHSGEEILLCEPPPAKFVSRLRARAVPLSRGRAIVATEEPHQAEVMQAIHDLGLELHIIFNKGSVMVLPSGVNKATGLQRALAELGIPAERVVGVGDAENDHAFLGMCGCAVAVANALPAIRQRAAWVTSAAQGGGVVELIDHLLHNDAVPDGRRRHQ